MFDDEDFNEGRSEQWFWIRMLVVVVVIIALLTIGVTDSHARPAHWREWTNLALKCEVKGQPHPWQTNTGNGFSGGPQFTPSAWRRYTPKARLKRWPSAWQAPQWQQILTAERQRWHQGLGAWPNCRSYWHA